MNKLFTTIIISAFSVLAGSPFLDVGENSLAGKLYSLELYEDAAFEFERSSQKSDTSRFIVAQCYWKSGNSGKAIEKFEEIIANSTNSSLVEKARLACVLIELERGNPKGTLEYSSNSWELAQAARDNWDSLGIEVRFKSPILAELQSLFIPGLGQIYAGETYEGIRSGAVNAGLWYSTISSALAGYLPRAIVIFYTFGHRYWLGGADRARVIAEKHNEAARLHASRELAKRLDNETNRECLQESR